jgi:hypothetical protein
MNTKARLLFIAAAAILMLGAAQMVSAIPIISVDYSISIAPSSIPVPESGNIIVGMNKVQISTPFSGGTTSVDQIVVQLISTGGFNQADIQSIRVWYEAPGGNTLYDNGTSIDDLPALSGGPYTFSSNPVTITLDTTVTQIGASAVARFYVGVELKSSAATAGTSIGVQVTSLRQTGKSPLTVTGHGVQKPLDKYRVGLTATGNAPVSGHTLQGVSTSIMKLAFSPVDTDASTKIRLASVKVHQVGAPWTNDNNLTSGGVVLYEDTNGNGTWDSGTDSQVTSATLGPSDHKATLTLSTPATIPSTGKTFFVVVNIALTAIVDDVVQLQVDNPSTDITFSDVYIDDVAGADYAYVPSGRPYTQKGYLTSAAATPTTNNSTIIDLNTTPPAPIVSSIVPGNNSLDVSRTIAVEATFSKDMVGASINGTNFKLFQGTNEIAGTVTFDGTVTATFTPSAPLAWGTTYTPHIYGGATGVQSIDEPSDMEFDKVWSFTTVAAVYPTVLSTSPLNGGIEAPRSTTVTATFSKAMNPATLTSSSFTLYDGTSYVAGTVSYDAPTRTATFTQTSPPLPWGTVCTATITSSATDTDGLSLLGSHVWTFTTTAPVNPLVAITSPANGESEVSMTGNVTATFSKDMDSLTLTISTFTLKDHLSAPVAGAVTFDDVSSTATFNPTPTLEWGETYTVTIKGGLTGALSLDGLPLLSDKVWTFTTVMPAYPIVISRTPVVGEVEVDIDSNITATFSKDIDASSIVDNTTVIVFQDANANHLYDAGTDTLAGSAASLTGAQVVTINPATDLAWNSTYYVNITTGVRDTDGLYLQFVAWWYFVTKVPVNPVVSNSVPALDATGVLPGATVTVSFSKDMRETETEAAFSLHVGESTGPAVPGTVNLGSPDVLTFTPSSPLTPGQKYTAVVHGDGALGSAQAIDLLYMLNDKVWSFYVSARPQVLLASPADGSLGVSRGTTIKAVFSKDVDDSTMTIATFHVEDGAAAPVSGTVTYDDTTFTATFTPDADLLFASYTVTIESGAAGVKDYNGIELASDVTWSFSTVPSLTEPVAANNRITPSSTDPVTIFIPQPPQGAADKVTVQVFTATGKKVTTLVNNLPWSAFQASLPLTWNGTNGLGEALGPGLYFIQIRATGYLRTLKVMIVR